MLKVELPMYWRYQICLAIGFVTAFNLPVALAACDAVDGFDYRGAQVKKIPNSSAYFYSITRMAIDADGAPNAYHPQDKGIDALANAGFPKGNWKDILVVDPAKPSQPFVQTDGKFAGFFVSQTTLQDRRLAGAERTTAETHARFARCRRWLG